MSLKEKIALKQLRNNSYRVISLENRTAPAIDTIITSAEVDILLIEAKSKQVLTVKIS